MASELGTRGQGGWGRDSGRAAGPEPTPCTRPQLTNKIVFVVSFVGNRGTFIRGYKAMVMDMEFLYHVGYILTSVLGLFAHELFYSILVRLRGVRAGAGAGQGKCSRSCPVLLGLAPVWPRLAHWLV